MVLGTWSRWGRRWASVLSSLLVTWLVEPFRPSMVAWSAESRSVGRGPVPTQKRPLSIHRPRYRTSTHPAPFPGIMNFPLGDGADPESQVADLRLGQQLGERFQESRLLEDEFLHQGGVADDDLEDTAPQKPDP